MEFDTIDTKYGLVKWAIKDPCRPTNYITELQLHDDNTFEGNDIIENIPKIIKEIQNANCGDYLEVLGETGFRTSGIYQIIVDKHGKRGFIDLFDAPDEYGTINPMGNIRFDADFKGARWHNQLTPLRVIDFIENFCINSYEPIYNSRGNFVINGSYYDRQMNIWIGNDTQILFKEDLINKFKRCYQNLHQMKDWYIYVNSEDYEGDDDIQIDCVYGFTYVNGILKSSSLDTLTMEVKDFSVKIYGQ